MIYFVLFALSPFIAALAFKILFSGQSAKQIMKKYSDERSDQKPEFKYLKKYPEADVERYRTAFLNLGLLLGISFACYSFTYVPAEPAEIYDLSADIEIPEELEVLPPVTKTPPPPPPKPPPPPVIDIVDDEEVIEDEVEIFEAEATEDSEIEIIDIPDIVDDLDEGDVESDYVEEVEIVEEPEVFIIVEDMPEFKGGQKALFAFLAKKTAYPPMARENGIEGTVYVGFIINESGGISDVHIKRGLSGGGAGCDQEALRVVNSMPNWKPGFQRGKAVKVAYTLPFKFQLN